MHHVTWHHIIEAERVCVLGVIMSVMAGFAPQWGSYIAKLFSWRDPELHERLAFGILCTCLGAGLYNLCSLWFSLFGRAPIPNWIPLTAGSFLLFGYYQIFVTWRSAVAGRAHGFAIRYALALLVLLTVAAVTMSYTEIPR